MTCKISDVYEYRHNNKLYGYNLYDIQIMMSNEVLLHQMKLCKVSNKPTPLPKPQIKKPKVLNKSIPPKKKRKKMDIITTLDVLKDEDFHSNKRNENNWVVCLAINLSGKYTKKGEKLKIGKKVKCLTVPILSCLSVEETERSINNKDTVPCLSLKPYCGFMPIIYAIDKFENFKEAKEAFRLLKQRTRGLFSRTQCAMMLYKVFKKDNKNLRQISTKLNPSKNIKQLVKYNNRCRKRKKKRNKKTTVKKRRRLR